MDYPYPITIRPLYDDPINMPHNPKSFDCPCVDCWVLDVKKEMEQ
jgi:hypothetical protein